MKMNQLEIFINAHGEIVAKQITNGKEEVVRITADQAEIIGEELKELAKQIKREQERKRQEGE